MSGTDAAGVEDARTAAGIVRAALAELAGAYRRDLVTDPRWIGELLAPRLSGRLAPDHPVVRAVVAATETPVLRNLDPAAPPATTTALLHHELRKLGHTDEASSLAAGAWVSILLPPAEAPVPAAPPVTAPMTVPVAADDDADRTPVAPVVAAPTPPAPPPGPPPAPRGPRPAAAPPPFVAPQPRPMPVAGRIGGDEAPAPRGWPPAARRALAALALVAVVAAGLAVVGWLRDPSKDRASAAEQNAAGLENELTTVKASLADAQKNLTERTKQLDDTKALAERTGTVTRAQLNGAVFPDQFTMTGKVAPGSCSLTGEACNVAAAVRAIKVTCATKPCDCTTGKCSVTSELWKSAAAVAFDPATNLFVAKGTLDGDVFRCAGVPQPTVFEFRFRVAKVTYGEGAWRVTGVDAELSQASAAAGECLAGARTYALGGPA